MPQSNPSPAGSTRLRALATGSGIAAVVLFVVIYAVELFQHGGPPVTIRWIRAHFGRAGLIALNLAVVAAFLALLPYRRPTKGTWQSKGAFLAFVIALMTEMFGWPLLIFLLSPLVQIPSLSEWWRATVGHYGALVGTWVSMLGVVLIAVGWRQIHRASGLVTTGLYRYMRHPQYTGIFLFTLGWILHWPSVVTLVLWPVLVAAYVWLAKREEQDALAEFGDAYAARTRRFLPVPRPGH